MGNEEVCVILPFFDFSSELSSMLILAVFGQQMSIDTGWAFRDKL